MLRAPRHLRPSPDRTPRLIGAALVVLLLAGTGAAAAGQSSPAPRAATATVRLIAEVAPSPVPVPVRAKPSPKPARKAAPPVRRHPAKRPVVRPAAARRPVTRWLPTGTGMWLHDWSRSERGNPRAVVARAQRAGLTTLYVQTGSSKKGFIAGPTLHALLPATKGTGIKVVAWDFPYLHDPVGDARRLAAAARWSCRGCPRVAAVAPDVETGAEGTRLSTHAVDVYYRTLRAALPRDIAILATVPWPSEKRVGRYPYAVTARHADAILPMAYWYNRAPATVTRTSMRYLQRFHKPVMPVGQGYDGRLDAPYLRPDPAPGRSVQAFMITARTLGARHVSLWSWQTTGGQQWAALSWGRKLYPRK